MDVKKIIKCILTLIIQVLYGVSALMSVKAVFSIESGNDVLFFILIVIFSILCYCIIESRSTTASVIFAVAIFSVLALTVAADVDKLLIASVYTAFLGTAWPELWNGRRGGSFAVLTVFLVFAAVPYFFGTENTVGVVTAAIASVFFLTLNYRVKGIKQDSTGGAFSTASMLFAVFAVCSAAAVFSTFFGNTKPNDILNREIQKISLLDEIGKVNSKFTLDDIGYNFEGGTLGGSVGIGDNTVMYVRTDSPIKLRCRIDNVYSDNKWSRSNPRYNYPFFRWIKGNDYKDIFCTELPKTNVPDGFFKNVEITVIPVLKNTNSLAVPVRVDDVDFGENKGSLIYNNLGEIFSSENIVSPYTVTAKIPNSDNGEFENWMRENSDSLTEKSEKTEQIKDLYCKVPKNYAGEISAYALDAMGDGSTYERVKRLENWLSGSMTYTHDPEDYTYSEDFVKNFLETKKGYCVHFATAMTVMLRTQGIPARYVTGFNISENEIENGIAVVTEKDAHAWCEVYFPGIGWIPFDPTAAASEGTEILPPETNENTPESDKSVSGQTGGADDAYGQSQTGKHEQRTESVEREEKNGKLVTITIALFLILVYICIAWNRNLIKKRCSVNSWHRIECALRSCKFKRESSETLSDFAQRVCTQSDRFFDCGLNEAAKHTECAIYSAAGCDCSENEESLKKLTEVMTLREKIGFVFLKLVL